MLLKCFEPPGYTIILSSMGSMMVSNARIWYVLITRARGVSSGFVLGETDWRPSTTPSGRPGRKTNSQTSKQAPKCSKVEGCCLLPRNNSRFACAASSVDFLFKSGRNARRATNIRRLRKAIITIEPHSLMSSWFFFLFVSPCSFTSDNCLLFSRKFHLAQVVFEISLGTQHSRYWVATRQNAQATARGRSGRAIS